MSEAKVWVGMEGGSDRLVVVTQGVWFYVSVRAFGWRVRLWWAGKRPRLQLVRVR